LIQEIPLEIVDQIPGYFPVFLQFFLHILLTTDRLPSNLINPQKTGTRTNLPDQS